MTDHEMKIRAHWLDRLQANLDGLRARLHAGVRAHTCARAVDIYSWTVTVGYYQLSVGQLQLGTTNCPTDTNSTHIPTVNPTVQLVVTLYTSQRYYQLSNCMSRRRKQLEKSVGLSEGWVKQLGAQTKRNRT